MEITNKDDLRVGDIATFTYNGHEFTGPLWEDEYGDMAIGSEAIRYEHLATGEMKWSRFFKFVRATRVVGGCSVDGCANTRDGRHLMCSGHRRRVKVHGDPQADVPLRKMGSGGVKRHPLYLTWKGIKARVYDTSSPSFHNYGGRGISMFPGWVNDSKAFLDWMDTNLGTRPDGYSLDRIDNDGNYEPGNLRWASASQQQMNSRKDGTEGISQRPNGKFQVWVQFEGRRHTVGTFSTFEEAAQARREALTPDLPVEPGSVILVTECRGERVDEPVAAWWDGVEGYWLTSRRFDGSTAHDAEDITEWTPAKVVPA